LPQGVKLCYDGPVALADALENGLETFRAIADRVGSVGRSLQSLLGRRARPRLEPGSTSAAADTHTRIARIKFDLGSPAVPFGGEARELPDTYGRDRAVLLARDPWWLFAYWEITPGTRAEAVSTLGGEAQLARLVLRIHDLTSAARGTDHGDPSIDVEVSGDAGSEYVNVGRPGVVVNAELGLCTRAGRFVPLVRSNTLQVPPSQASADGTVSWLPMRMPTARGTANRPRSPDALANAGTPPSLRSGDAGVRH
jgi:hypothetical protein